MSPTLRGQEHDALRDNAKLDYVRSIAQLAVFSEDYDRLKAVDRKKNTPSLCRKKFTHFRHNV